MISFIDFSSAAAVARALGLVGVTLAIGCGGVTTVGQGDDAGADSAGPISECHGYCPQPNGSTCSGDCDCDNKCLSGTDKPARCADPVVAEIPCGDAAACPPGQTCGSFGICQGATCAASDDCPSKQQCVSGACSAFGCL